MTDTLTAEATTDGYAPRTIELGTVRVTALHDGHFDLPASFIGQVKDEPTTAADDTFQLDVNAFLIQSGTRTVLVDTGAGSQLGPQVNKLIPNLLSLGLAPADIDTVLCTHIHPDHTNGLVDADGSPMFPNAEVFVHQVEIDYWLKDASYAIAPAGLRQTFDWARASFKPYAGRIKPFTAGMVLPGIEALPLFGHTPGHSGFQIDGGGKHQLIIWGDAVHRIDIQSRNPDISVQADMSQEAARATRHALFDRVVADDALVTGMHVTFPGFGRMRRDGAGFEYAAQG